MVNRELYKEFRTSIWENVFRRSRQAEDYQYWTLDSIKELHGLNEEIYNQKRRDIKIHFRELRAVLAELTS